MQNNFFIVAASLVATANAALEQWETWASALGTSVDELAVSTHDSYVLKMLHLTPEVDNGSSPILLMHGAKASADSWVNFLTAAPQDSLPFQLAEAGYHVYVGNNRGTTFYSAHETLSKSQPEFWMYSHEEMGDFDVPAFANAIKMTSGADKITFIGNSAGADQAFSGQIRNSGYWQETFDKVIHIAGCGYAPSPDFLAMKTLLAPLLNSDIKYIYGPNWGNLQQEICNIPGMGQACSLLPMLKPIPLPFTNSFEPQTLRSIFHYSQNDTLQQFASRYEPYLEWNGTTKVGTPLSFQDIDKVPQYVFAAKENDNRCPAYLSKQVFEEIAAPKAYFQFVVSEHDDFVLEPEITISDLLDVLSASEGEIYHQGRREGTFPNTCPAQASDEYFFYPGTGPVTLPAAFEYEFSINADDLAELTTDMYVVGGWTTADPLKEFYELKEDAETALWGFESPTLAAGIGNGGGLINNASCMQYGDNVLTPTQFGKTHKVRAELTTEYLAVFFDGDLDRVCTFASPISPTGRFGAWISSDAHEVTTQCLIEEGIEVEKPALAIDPSFERKIPNNYAIIDDPKAWGEDDFGGNCKEFTDESYRIVGDQSPLFNDENSNVWAIYEIEGVINEYHLLNVKRAEKCSNAWLTVHGDCSNSSSSIKWANYKPDLKPWKFSQWRGGPSNPLEINSSFLGGVLQNFFEARGSCSANPMRFATFNKIDADGIVSSEMPGLAIKEIAASNPYYDFCYLDSCLTYAAEIAADRSFSPIQPRLEP